MNLRLIDIGPFIHAGKVNKRANYEGDLTESDKGWYIPSLATGGVAFIFNIIRKYMHQDLLVFAADRDSLFRKEIDPMYQANRKDKIEDEIQKNLAEYILEDCGFNVCFKERYESDDILYTFCKRNKDKVDVYDHIYVHTNDSDLYMCVNDRVSIEASSSNGKNVTMENYSFSFGKDKIMPYNECNFYKMIHGDISDNYKGVDSHNLAIRLNEICHTKYVKQYLGDSEKFEKILESLCPEALPKFQVAYQHLLDVDFDPYKPLNKSKIMIWGHLIGNSSYSIRDVDITSLEYKNAKSYMDELVSKVNNRS